MRAPHTVSEVVWAAVEGIMLRILTVNLEIAKPAKFLPSDGVMVNSDSAQLTRNETRGAVLAGRTFLTSVIERPERGGCVSSGRTDASPEDLFAYPTATNCFRS